MRRNMTRGRYSVRMLFVTVMVGVIYALVAEGFYRIAEDVIPGVVLIPLYFTGLFLVLGAAVYLTGKLIYSRTFSGINKRQWVITLLLILALSALFEFLYEIAREKKQAKEITSFLFVLDDSGSMESNDPERIRYQAIDTLLEGKEDSFQYGIYSFNNESTVLRNMAPKSQAQDYILPEVNGGTAIMGTLVAIKDSLETGELLIDESCKVILLSDGYATDISFTNKNKVAKILESFAQRGICISTVGLADADDSLMSMIADKTGGVYVKANDISTLDEAMNQAASATNVSRNLLGYRAIVSFDLLLGFMRIAFITVLGIIIAGEKTVLCERFLDTRSVLISSTAGSILAGFCIEIGMNTVGVHPTVMRMVTCALIAFTLLKKDIRANEEANSGVKYADR